MLETFRRLHREGLLVLPNAWDAGTARLFESSGAAAIATTSAGVAWSHGYADGDLLPVDLLERTVGEIVRVVRIPVSVDVEGGYASAPQAVAEVVKRLAGLGAVGINIEDGSGAPDLLVAKIEAVKRAADVFVNARTDVYLKGLVPEEQRLEETLSREARYRAAGADGIFVPGLTDGPTIGRLAAGVKLPLNVLSRPGLPGLADLKQLGVRRLSAGSWLTSHVYGRAASLARTFLADGMSAPLFEGAMPYPEANALFAPR